MLEYGGWVALFLVLVQMALILWLISGERADRNRVKHFVAVSAFNTLLIAFFWLGNRITEITFSSVGTIKAQADQASQYVSEIKRIRLEVEQEQQAINAAAAAAQNASRLSKELEAKNTQASKQLVELEKQLSVAAEMVRYTTTVLAAQADDRAAFEQLQAWSKDSSFPYQDMAGRASLAIEDNLENLMLDYHVPWQKGVDPAKLTFDELRKMYDSPELDTNLRIALVQYIASRSDISERDRLQFLINVMHQNPNLKVVAYAGQAFAQVAKLNEPLAPNTHMRPLALQIFFDWWKNNASKLP
jgi:hypothetical protein